LKREASDAGQQDRANIEDDELSEFRRLVKVYAGLTMHQVNQLIHAISFNAYAVDSLAVDRGSTLGEVSPGIDLNWLNPNPAYGLNMADIHGNSHLGQGLVLPLINNSRIQVSTLYGSPRYAQFTGGSSPLRQSLPTAEDSVRRHLADRTNSRHRQSQWAENQTHNKRPWN
jgi:hypothetical protein